MMNTVNLVGRVATKPELAYTPGGLAVATMRIAVERPKPRPDDEGADFFTVKAYGRLGDAQKDYLDVGRLIAVTGRLHDNSYEADGKTRDRVEVIASSIDWLDRPPTVDDGAAEPGEH